MDRPSWTETYSVLEYWMPVVGYEEHYEVSTHARVRTIPRLVKCRGRGFRMVRQRILKDGCRNRPGQNGYRYVCLAKDGINTTYDLHVLVAKAFIPNPDGLPMVNHRDGVKTNCHVSNLEWTDAQGNADHASRLGLLTRSKRGQDLVGV